MAHVRNRNLAEAIDVRLLYVLRCIGSDDLTPSWCVCVFNVSDREASPMKAAQAPIWAVAPQGITGVLVMRLCIHSSFFVLNVMLPACSPNFAGVVCTVQKAEQTCS